MYLRRSEAALLVFAGLAAGRASASSYGTGNSSTFSLFKSTTGQAAARSLSTPGFSVSCTSHITSCVD
jgi:hypothetical protein